MRAQDRKNRIKLYADRARKLEDVMDSMEPCDEQDEFFWKGGS